MTDAPRMRVGFDWGGTKIEAIALGETGETLMRQRLATPQGDYDGCIRCAAGLLEMFERETGRCASVGFGIPGSLSPTTGLVRNANSTWLNGRPLKLDLELILDRPVRIENDANCLAVSEAVDGAGAGASVVFAAVVGSGAGAGVAVGGRPWGGKNGIAGEFGHNPLPWAAGTDETPGPSCWCGRRGCIETFVSGHGFARAHALATGRPMTAEAIVGAAEGGDPDAARSLELYCDRLARSLATVVNLIDPEVIVLGGGMSNVEALYETLPARIAAHAFSDGLATPVRRAQHGDSSGVRGAAWLWDR